MGHTNTGGRWDLAQDPSLLIAGLDKQRARVYHLRNGSVVPQTSRLELPQVNWS